MEFSSPRFAGNPILEEILNDANTGTKKLGKNSDPDAVKAVQQALLDLFWPQLPFLASDGTPFTSEHFVDGDYGPMTEETVLAYKQHYDIHFPPDAPTGFIDSFTGPATIQSLDRHCTLLDEANAAMVQHASDVLASGAVGSLDYHADGFGRLTRPVQRSAGALASALVNGEVASLTYKRDIGAFLIYGPLYITWAENEQEPGTAAATGQLGFPVSDVAVDAFLTRSWVERGSIVHDAETGNSTLEIDESTFALRHEIEF